MSLRSRSNVVLLMSLFTVVSGARVVTAQPAVERLRAAWIEHRLAGKLEESHDSYKALYDDIDVSPEIRCRAAVGLGLVARDQGELDRAQSWFADAAAVRDAPARWTSSARRLLAATNATIESERDPQRSVDDFQREIDALKRDRARFQALIGEREGELQRQDELIARLRSTLQGAEEAHRLQDQERSERASGVLRELVEQERDAERLKRYLISQGVRRCQQHLDEGRLLHATNEIKRVLEIDSQHAEARRLLQLCQVRLAQASGQQTLARERVSAELQPEVSRRLVVDVMGAYLTEARRFYRTGSVGRAIAAYERVLTEYALSPVPLSPDEVNTLVAPAEYGLRRCFEELGVGGSSDLTGERSTLLSELRKDAQRLLEQQQALEKAESDVEELKSQNPEQGASRAREEIDRSLAKAEAALARGSRAEAVEALRAVLTLLNWFPSLDREGLLSRRVAKELESLSDEPIPEPKE